MASRVGVGMPVDEDVDYNVLRGVGTFPLRVDGRRPAVSRAAIPKKSSSAFLAFLRVTPYVAAPTDLVFFCMPQG